MLEDLNKNTVGSAFPAPLIIDFTKISAALDKNSGPLAGSEIRSALSEFSEVFIKAKVSKEMWDLISQVAVVPSNLSIKFLFNQLIECWQLTRSNQVALYLADALKADESLIIFSKVVTQLNYIFNLPDVGSKLPAIIIAAKSLLPDLKKTNRFLEETENLFRLKTQFKTNDLFFLLSAYAAVIKNNWDWPASKKEIQVFIGQCKTKRERALVLCELEALEGTDRFQTSFLARVIKGDLGVKELVLLESFFQGDRFTSSDKAHLGLMGAVRVASKLSKATPEHQNFIIENLRNFKGDISEYCEGTIYYKQLLINNDNLIKAEKLFDSVIRGGSSYIQDAHLLAELPYLIDQPPWISGTREESEARNQSIMIAAGAKDYSQGFGVYTYAAKSLPDGSPAALERFAKDIFKEVSKVNAADIGQFPGRGWFFSMPKTESFLAKDDQSEIEFGDSFLNWKRNLPFLAEEIDIFNQTQVLVTRGLAAFVNFDRKFTYFGEPYCYLVFNDHFHRYDHQVAALVPWRIILEAVQSSLVNLKTAQKPSVPIADVNNQGLSVEYLKRKCRQLDLPYLDISSATVIGGLCNAFPSCSPYYHKWEDSMKMSGSYKSWSDLWGHYHKALIDNDWHPEGVPEWKEKLYRPLQKAHAEVLELSLGYQNIAHLFKLAFSFWQKGYYYPTQLEAGLPLLPARPTLKETEARDDFLKLKLLREAHHWHSSASAKGLADSAFPILGINNLFQLSSSPANEFKLDTKTMLLTWLEDGKIHKYPLSTEGIVSDDSRVWLNHISPLFEDLTASPNFFDREVFEE